MKSWVSRGVADLGANPLARATGGAEHTILPLAMLPRDLRHAHDLSRAAFDARPADDSSVGDKPLRDYLARDVRQARTFSDVHKRLDRMLDGVASPTLVDAAATPATTVVTEAVGSLAPGAVSVMPPITVPTDADLGTIQQGLGSPEVKKMLDCWLNADYHTYWWGWSVCLNQECAIRLQDMILKLEGGKASMMLFAAIKGLIAGAAPAAAAKAAMLAAGTPLVAALVVVGFYIAISIKLNITGRGVCISGNWTIPLPIIGQIGQMIWVKGR
jgi:hypothetical protein